MKFTKKTRLNYYCVTAKLGLGIGNGDGDRDQHLDWRLGLRFRIQDWGLGIGDWGLGIGDWGLRMEGRGLRIGDWD